MHFKARQQGVVHLIAQWWCRPNAYCQFSGPNFCVLNAENDGSAVKHASPQEPLPNQAGFIISHFLRLELELIMLIAESHESH